MEEFSPFEVVFEKSNLEGPTDKETPLFPAVKDASLTLTYPLKDTSSPETVKPTPHCMPKQELPKDVLSEVVSPDELCHTSKP